MRNPPHSRVRLAGVCYRNGRRRPRAMFLYGPAQAIIPTASTTSMAREPRSCRVGPVTPRFLYDLAAAVQFDDDLIDADFLAVGGVFKA